MERSPNRCMNTTKPQRRTFGSFVSPSRKGGIACSHSHLAERFVALDVHKHYVGYCQLNGNCRAIFVRILVLPQDPPGRVSAVTNGGNLRSDEGVRRVGAAHTFVGSIGTQKGLTNSMASFGRTFSPFTTIYQLFRTAF